MGKEKYIRIVLIVISLMLVFPGVVLGEPIDITEESGAIQSDTSKLNIESDLSDSKRGIEKKVVKELKEKRDYNTKHYLLEDGTMKAEVYQGNAHYLDALNNWEDIDSTLIDEVDIDTSKMKVSKEIASEAKAISNTNKAKKAKSIDRSQTNFRALHVPFNVTIPKDYRKGYSISKGTDKLGFVPLNANKAVGIVDMKERNSVLYKNAWQQTDVKLTVTNEGIKEFIYLLDQQAPKKFSFELNTKLSSKLEHGQLYIAPLWMADSKGAFKYIAPTITSVGNKTFFHIEVDTTGMTFPITIDPSVGFVRMVKSDTYVDSKFPTMNYGPFSEIKVGHISGYYNGSMTYESYNGYYNFDLSGFNNASVITDAMLFLYAKNINLIPGTGQLNIAAYRVTSPWSTYGMTWNTRASYTTDNAASQRTFTSTSTGWWHWYVLNIVKDAIITNQPYGFMMQHTADKSGLGGYVNFSSEASTTYPGGPDYRPHLVIFHDPYNRTLQRWQTYKDYINNAETHYYKFKAPKTDTYHFSLKAPASKNYDIEIASESGTSTTVIATGNQPTGVQEEISIRLTQDQTYYIRVYGMNGSYDTSNPYTLRVTDNARVYNYDQAGRLQSMIYEKGLTRYTIYYYYDNNGNLINKVPSSSAITS
ncbi:DNRLRE domain-containing protein [Paenibacillus oenotherae]|uniref:DNRLRE domain-containing protein n=1 Tax=Paenibacillus oenotherae TaxID=1435645 RepID=A0ABS7DCN0_9BACL|nr:DNRLRE domain-containing protein [Paenibacillus oenotherae]MBW7477661.1 DNRLRE domain-containing protein [Paenibacillus oenotherae]